ncbi:MAG: 50S ribosomal protein L14e [Candidatus Woesearchaeota archaeon]
MMEVGRLCVKIAGRDSNKKCVIIDKIDSNYVLIDGLTRRKKVNVKHLEPLADVVDIKKGASHSDVVKVFKELGLDIVDKKPKQKTSRPIHQRKTKEKIFDLNTKKKSVVEQKKKAKNEKKEKPKKDKS